jgi:hypothetical protein
MSIAVLVALHREASVFRGPMTRITRRAPRPLAADDRVTIRTWCRCRDRRCRSRCPTGSPGGSSSPQSQPRASRVQPPGDREPRALGPDVGASAERRPAQARAAASRRDRRSRPRTRRSAPRRAARDRTRGDSRTDPRPDPRPGIAFERVERDLAGATRGRVVVFERRKELAPRARRCCARASAPTCRT